MKTALTGRFKSGLMKSAFTANITAERCNNGIKEIKISMSKDNTSPTFKYSRPTKFNIGDTPTLEDPYESVHVFVDNVKELTGEKGLFARKPIQKGQLIAYYSGVIWNTTEEELLPKDVSSTRL